MIKICKATKNDIDDLLPLLEQLGYPQNTIHFQKHFQKFLKQQDYGIEIAILDKKVVGLVAWSKSLCFVSEKIRIHLEGLVVDKHHRKKGIGKALMKHLEEVSRQFSPALLI